MIRRAFYERVCMKRGVLGIGIAYEWGIAGAFEHFLVGGLYYMEVGYLDYIYAMKSIRLEALGPVSRVAVCCVS